MDSPEHRHFARIGFRHGARFSVAGHTEACEILDLSLKGALLQLQDGAAITSGASCSLELVLDDGEAVVRMDGHVAHCSAGRIGLACTAIDLDSITHLRRLIELNQGDATLLERELAALLPH